MTLFDMFLKVTTLHKNKIAFIHKIKNTEYKVTYKEFFNDVLLLSKAFRKKGLKKK